VNLEAAEDCGGAAGNEVNPRAENLVPLTMKCRPVGSGVLLAASWTRRDFGYLIAAGPRRASRSLWCPIRVKFY